MALLQEVEEEEEEEDETRSLVRRGKKQALGSDELHEEEEDK
jgi:hypothetical protein